MDLKKLKHTVWARFVLLLVLLGLAFFLPAGTLRYWQAWTYHGIAARRRSILARTGGRGL